MLSLMSTPPGFLFVQIFSVDGWMVVSPGAGSQHRGQGDGVACLQGVDLQRPQAAVGPGAAPGDAQGAQHHGQQKTADLSASLDHPEL